MARHWVLKTEPSEYGYSDLVRERRTRWEGVSNPVALRHLRSMEEGDEALIYHTGKEKAIVGLARIASAPYPDPRDAKLVVVDVEPLKPLPEAVPLPAIRAEPSFADLGLVRMPRLSVVPVEPAQWKRLLAMGGIQANASP